MKTLLSEDSLVFNPPQLGCVLFLSGLPGSGNKIYDKSPYCNIGTITGATWVRLPSGLWCLSFDGTDDKVDCGNADNLKLTTVTWETWVKPEDLTTSAKFHIIIVKDNSYRSGLCVDYVSNAVAGVVFTQRITAGGEDTIEYTGVSAGNWYHVVGVGDGSDMELFVQGVSRGTATETYTPTKDTESVIIGGGVTNRYTKGTIALPRIYNWKLTAFEIQNHFNREKHLFGIF